MVRNIIILLFITVLSYGQDAASDNETPKLHRGMINDSRATAWMNEAIIKTNRHYDSIFNLRSSIQENAINISSGVSSDTTDALRGDVNAIENIFKSSDSTITVLNYMDFAVVNGIAHQERRLHWNDNDKTVEVGLDGGSILQIGQEIHLRATNKTGSQIDNGSVVYVTGAQGQRPTIALADNESVATSLTTIGIATQDIADNGTGYVTLIGLVRDLNTSAFSDGDLVWLDTLAGGLTATRPSAPLTEMAIGVVLYSHGSEGIIVVHPVLGQRLAWLSDVGARGTQLDGDVLEWSSDSSEWKAVSDMTLNTAKVTNATHTGDVTGSGELTIAVDAVDIPMLSASGSPSGTTYLSGNNTWSTPAGGDFAWIDSSRYYENVQYITDHGAVSGDASSDVVAIQAAIDSAFANITDMEWMYHVGYGGKVVFPPGDWDIDDTIVLRSWIEYDIAAGANFNSERNAYDGPQFSNPRGGPIENTFAGRQYRLQGINFHGGAYHLTENGKWLELISDNVYSQVMANVFTNFNVKEGNQVVYMGRTGIAPYRGEITANQFHNGNIFQHDGFAFYMDSVSGSVISNIQTSTGVDTTIKMLSCDGIAITNVMAWDADTGFDPCGIYMDTGCNYNVIVTPWLYSVIDEGHGNIVIGNHDIDDNLALIKGSNFKADRSSDVAGTSSTLWFRRKSDVDDPDVVNGQETGEIGFYGYHTDGYDEAAAIRGFIEGTPGNGDMPGVLIFYATPDASATAVEIMKMYGNNTIRVDADLDPRTISDRDLGGSGSEWTDLWIDRVICTPAASVGTQPGAIYFDSDDNHFYGYNGSGWVQLDN